MVAPRPKISETVDGLASRTLAIARMLAGDESEAARLHAAELLAQSHDDSE